MARPARNEPHFDEAFDQSESGKPAEKRAGVEAAETGEIRPKPRQTAAPLKEDVDRGKAGTKVAAEDAPATPLGTDDEAAGAPPSWLSVDAARREEVGKAPRAAKKRQYDVGGIVYLIALALFAAALSAAVVLAFF